MAPKVLGAVLAGGTSRRMGRDKASVVLGGVSMLERAVDILAEVCPDVVVVSSREETPAGAWEVIEDLRPGAGPLAGLEAALSHGAREGYQIIVVLACDLPLAGADLVREVLRVGQSNENLGAWAAAAARDGVPDFEPLCAAYSTTCLPVASALLDGGNRAARALFEAVDGARVVPSESDSDGSDHAPGLLNVNTEADLLRAEAGLSKR